MEALLQDVTLTAGFGLPSDAVALFGRPVPFLQLLHFAQVESSKCAPAGGCPLLMHPHSALLMPWPALGVTFNDAIVAWQVSLAKPCSNDRDMHACDDGDMHACVCCCASVHAFGEPRGEPGGLGPRRVSNPLTRLQYQLLPFLPPVRESRRRHAALYRLYADMCDRLEVRQAPGPARGAPLGAPASLCCCEMCARVLKPPAHIRKIQHVFVSAADRCYDVRMPARMRLACVCTAVPAAACAHGDQACPGRSGGKRRWASQRRSTGRRPAARAERAGAAARRAGRSPRTTRACGAACGASRTPARARR